MEANLTERPPISAGNRSVPAGADYAFYEQVPLGAGRRSIRLVTLLPGTATAPIQCTLEAADLDDGPEYEALSYCWGADDALQRIKVNDNALYVTPNLYSALRHLRNGHDPRRLWVDKICINQWSFSERAAQVSIMKEIYASSLVTIAWLGGDDLVDSTFIQNFFQSDCGRQKIERAQAQSSSSAVSDSWLRRATQKIQGWYTDYRTDFVSKLNATLQATYFTRVWILQEIAVSSNVILQCGGSTTKLESIVRAYRHCMSNKNHFLYHREHEVAWHEVGTILDLLHEVDFRNISLPLSSCLSHFRSSRSSQKVDKIFALYGLASLDVQRLHLRADYELPEVEVYIEVALSCLQGLGDLSILEVPRGSSELRETLPSWAPDWSDHSSYGTGLSPETQALRRPLWRASPDLQQSAAPMDSSLLHPSSRSMQWFHASRATSVAPVHKVEENRIHVRSMIFDTAAELSPEVGLLGPNTLDWDAFLWNREGFAVEFARFRASIEEQIGSWKVIESWRHKLFQRCGPRYISGERTELVFLRTLCTDSVLLETPFHSVEALAEEYKSFFPNPTDQDMAIDIDSATELDSFTRGVWRRWREFARLCNIFKTTCRRRLVLTAEGYFGLVPAETKLDDAIIIPHGGSLPLVVRPSRGAFTLIGEAYVHGIMHGEAWDETLCSSIVLR